MAISGPIPERLQEALNFVSTDESRELTYEDLPAYNLRLKDFSRLLASKFVTGQDEHVRVPERTRITARAIFGLTESTTRQESRRMAKAKHEEAQAKKHSEATRKE